MYDPWRSQKVLSLNDDLKTYSLNDDLEMYSLNDPGSWGLLIGQLTRLAVLLHPLHVCVHENVSTFARPSDTIVPDLE